MFLQFSVNGEARKNQKLILTHSAIHWCAHFFVNRDFQNVKFVRLKTSHHHHICWHKWCNKL